MPKTILIQLIPMYLVRYNRYIDLRNLVDTTNGVLFDNYFDSGLEKILEESYWQK